MATNSTAERALELLGSGLGPEVVSSALGVSTSYISQLLSSEEFSAQVAELRFKALSKHNERDNSYDGLEDQLLTKMKGLLPLMMRPMEVLAAIKVINGAKRRGTSAPEHITNKATIIQLNIPTKLIQNFTTNINNQVITTGQQTLTTIQSGSMDSLLNKARTQKAINNQEVIENERTFELSAPRT